MLDQSFSYENFRIILDVENRKGKYLENESFFKNDDIFKKSREITDIIIEINQQINEEFIKLKKISVKESIDYKTYDDLKEKKDLIKQFREIELEKILLELSKKTNTEDYKIKIEKGKIKFGSQLYTVLNKPEHYFVLKQLQRNIYKTFKVKQADRKTIISQLKLLLDDGFPKIIIRTDIKSFYETIPHKQLLSKIEENSLLSYPSKKIIKDILNQYWKILITDGVKLPTDERVGIPRGIGISAYLSELYMRNFDRKISTYSNVTYYARYVDDIIIIITPENRNEIKSIGNYKNEIKSIVNKSTSLNINLDKTSLIDLRKENKERKVSINYRLTYLGYQFIFGYKKKKDGNKEWIEKTPLKIAMSDNKLKRYEDKIIESFNDYSLNRVKYLGLENGINKILLQRIKFLTNNFQLVRRKSNVFIGIYFSNEFLNDFEDLKKLDYLLKNKISTISTISTTGNTNLTDKLNKLSFEKGFVDKHFLKFNFKSFQNGKVLSIWKNL